MENMVKANHTATDVKVNINPDSLINCTKLYPKHDCNQTTFLFQDSINSYHWGYNVTYVSIEIKPDIEPSFLIISKPRIDNIDYVTYIFGTFGFWFGFSFIMINPVLWFFAIETKQSESENNEISLLNNRLVVLENEKYQDRKFYNEHFRLLFTEIQGMKNKIKKPPSLMNIAEWL